MGGYDYYWLMSGQDWPIKSTEQIVEFLSNSENKNYIYYLTSKNHGNKGPNNLDKRNQIFLSAVDYWKKTMAKGNEKSVGRNIWRL